MSKHFAVIKNNLVEAVIIAEEATVVGFFYEDADSIVEVTEATGPASAGFEYRKNKFICYQPYASWTFDEKKWEWKAPTAKPAFEEGKYSYWDEDTTSWIVELIPADVQTAE